MKIDAAHAHAIARLSRSDDGKVLLLAVRAEMDRAKDLLVGLTDDAAIHRQQGVVRALKFFAEAVELSPDLVSKLEHRANSR